MPRDLSPENLLVLAAARLARTSPSQWDEFVKALAGFSASITQNCIQSPLDELARAQGRAQSLARLTQSLADARSMADKLEGKKQ